MNDIDDSDEGRESVDETCYYTEDESDPTTNNPELDREPELAT